MKSLVASGQQMPPISQSVRADSRRPSRRGASGCVSAAPDLERHYRPHRWRRADRHAVSLRQRERVEVADTEVRIMGSKSELLRTLVAASGGKSGVVRVQSSVLKWRARRDSNSRPLPSESSGQVSLQT